MNNKDILAIIPARGGSKGIHRKNIIDLCGKPLIGWSIDVALKTKDISRVIVSTDDEEIATIAKEHGAEVPFIRPKEFAEDNTPTIDVLRHAIEWLNKNEGTKYATIVLLEPTSPARTPDNISNAINLFMDKQADSVVSVVEVDKHYNPDWQFLIKENQELYCFTGEDIRNITPRRQDLNDTYTRNGAIYVMKTSNIFGDRPSLYGEKVYAYVMDKKDSIDINTQDDLLKAELIMKKIYKNKDER